AELTDALQDNPSADPTRNDNLRDLLLRVNGNVTLLEVATFKYSLIPFLEEYSSQRSDAGFATANQLQQLSEVLLQASDEAIATLQELTALAQVAGNLADYDWEFLYDQSRSL